MIRLLALLFLGHVGADLLIQILAEATAEGSGSLTFAGLLVHHSHASQSVVSDLADAHLREAEVNILAAVAELSTVFGALAGSHRVILSGAAALFARTIDAAFQAGAFAAVCGGLLATYASAVSCRPAA